MRGSTVKKIKREINSKEKDVVNGVFDCFNSMSFTKRVRIAFKIIFKKL